MNRLISLFVFLIAALSAYQYDVSITAIFQNEAKWMKEWIEYHRLIGVKHFYLYNHMSTDNYKEVLQPYINQGIVELTEWRYPVENVEHWTKIQTRAYWDAIKKSKHETKWLAILDLDEFVVPTQDRSLAHFLTKYERYAGLAIHWQMFGTSDVERVPDDKLMIEVLTWKAPDDYPENSFIKTIVQPKYVKEIKDPHKPVWKKGYFSVNSRKERAGKNSTNKNFDLEKIRINHYWSRDREYFYLKKRPRREGWQEGFDGQLARVNNLKHHEDHFILRFVPELRQRMGLD